MNDFWILCDLFDDDVNIVAKIIQEYHTKRLKLSRIREDIEECKEGRIYKYFGTISKILDLDIHIIKEFKERHNDKLNLSFIKIPKRCKLRYKGKSVTAYQLAFRW